MLTNWFSFHCVFFDLHVVWPWFNVRCIALTLEKPTDTSNIIFGCLEKNFETFDFTWTHFSTSNFSDFVPQTTFREFAWIFRASRGEVKGLENFSKHSKTMLEVSVSFCNVRALQRTLHHGHTIRRSKNISEKRLRGHEKKRFPPRTVVKNNFELSPWFLDF